MSRRTPAALTWHAASKPPIQNESKSGRAPACSGATGEFRPPELPDKLAVQSQSLCDDLIHVVVLVRGQASDEMHTAGCGRQHLVLPVQLAVLRLRHRIVRISRRARVLVHQA